MTVTYNHDLATARFTAIIRTIFRWKGGVWKSVYLEVIAWCTIYGVLSAIYRRWLSEHERE